MRLADMPTHGDWVRVLLGEDPLHEIAFGVVGRFWAGETVWRRSTPPTSRRSPSPVRQDRLQLLAAPLRRRPDTRDLRVSDARDRRDRPSRLHALLAATGAIHRPGHALTTAGNRGGDHRPLDREGAHTVRRFGTGREQEQSINRPRSFPASDTARDSARAGAQTPNARIGGFSRRVRTCADLDGNANWAR